MNLTLAPMAAITHAGLRRLIHEFADPDEYFTEMIHAPSLISGGNFEKWYLHTAPTPEKLVWQITSPTIEPAVKSVPIVLTLGGLGIDLNMGCCAPQIVSQGAGFAWMLKPIIETAKYVCSIKKEIGNFMSENNSGHIRLSVKLRLGKEENYKNLLNFANMLVSEGVELVTLHPRLQKDSYSRLPKYQYIAELAEDLNIPVYGNGDIFSIDSFNRITEKYKCAGWMIGRAAVQKPWIFQELQKGETMHSIDLLNIAEKFILYMQEEQPEEFHKTRRQRFYTYFANNFKFANYIKSKLLNAKTNNETIEIIKDYIAQSPSEQFT